MVLKHIQTAWMPRVKFCLMWNQWIIIIHFPFVLISNNTTCLNECKLMNTDTPALSDGGTTMNFTLKGHILLHHRPVFDQILRKVANLISACIYTEHTCDFPHTFKTWVKEFDPLTINSLVLVQWGTLVAHLSLVSFSANFLSPLHLPIKCPKTTIKEGRLVIVIFYLCIYFFCLLIGLLFNEGHHVLDLQTERNTHDKQHRAFLQTNLSVNWK